MKPKIIKNLSLPLNPQGEEAMGTIKFSSQEKKKDTS